MKTICKILSTGAIVISFTLVTTRLSWSTNQREEPLLPLDKAVNMTDMNDFKSVKVDDHFKINSLPVGNRPVSDEVILTLPFVNYIDRDEATSIVHSEVVFDHSLDILRYPDLLPVGQLITNADDEVIFRTLDVSWLFFIDHEPGAFWSHASEVMLVNQRTGEVQVFQTEDYPLFDGTMEVFNKDNDADAYVYSYREDPAVDLSLDTNNPSMISPVESSIEDMFPYLLESDELGCPPELENFGYCEDDTDYSNNSVYYCANLKTPKRYVLLIKGPPKDRGKWGAKYDKIDINNAIKGFSEELRVKQRGFSTGGKINGGVLTLSKKPETAAKQLQKSISKLAKVVTCNDEVFIYYAGHGDRVNKSKCGKGAKDSAGCGKDAEGSFEHRISKGITAGFLRDQLKKLNTCHLHVVIDSCYSGGFVDVLKTLPGLETMYTSAAADETAKVSRWDEGTPFDEKQAEQGGEFTSGFIKHLRQNRPTQVFDKNFKPVWRNKPKTVKELLEDAYQTALANDSAKKAGLTHPQRYVRSKECRCDEKGSRFISFSDCPDPYWEDKGEGFYINDTLFITHTVEPLKDGVFLGTILE